VKPADAGAGAQDKAAAKHGAVECFFVIKKEKMKAMRDCGQDATLAPGVGCGVRVDTKPHLFP
jgi:hypothetical protein